jgi:hypothetical protein
MTSKAIVALILTVGGSPEEARILDAFAMQESSRAARGINVPGDYNEKKDIYGARGIWQFHKARWKECGGKLSEWGKASKEEQARVMLRALRKYACKSKWGNLTAEQKIIVAGRCHNNGHCKKSEKNRHTSYTRSVWKYYKAIKSPKKSQAPTTQPVAAQSIQSETYIAGFAGLVAGMSFCGLRKKAA